MLQPHNRAIEPTAPQMQRCIQTRRQSPSRSKPLGLRPNSSHLKVAGRFWSGFALAFSEPLAYCAGTGIVVQTVEYRYLRDWRAR